MESFSIVHDRVDLTAHQWIFALLQNKKSTFPGYWCQTEGCWAVSTTCLCVDITLSSFHVFVGRQVWAQVWLCRELCTRSWHRAVNWYVTDSAIDFRGFPIANLESVCGWVSKWQFVRTKFCFYSCYNVGFFFFVAFNYHVPFDCICVCVCVFSPLLRQLKPSNSSEASLKSCLSNMARRSLVSVCACVCEGEKCCGCKENPHPVHFCCRVKSFVWNNRGIQICLHKPAPSHSMIWFIGNKWGILLSFRCVCFVMSQLNVHVPVSDEQFVLMRVADCAIDLYAMVVVLSRYEGNQIRGVLRLKILVNEGEEKYKTRLTFLSFLFPLQGLTLSDSGSSLGSAREDAVWDLVCGGKTS